MRKANKSTLLKKIAKAAPHLAVSVDYELDRNFVWDGDGPDPIEEGYDPYDVTVRVSAIVDGEEVFGDATLGGTYEKSVAEADPDINGYLNQMVDEAVEALLSRTSSATVKAQCKKALAVLKRERDREYQKQQRRK